jgi:hypothetical protein
MSMHLIVSLVSLALSLSSASLVLIGWKRDKRSAAAGDRDEQLVRPIRRGSDGSLIARPPPNEGR